MKKFLSLFIFISVLIFTSCAENYSVNENYDLMQFEINCNGKVIYSLPFKNFAGCQKVSDKFVFIDCSHSRISEYGEIFYFDFKTKQLKYTGIYSGAAFYISENSKYLLASTLVEDSKKSDIEDIFGTGLDGPKKYPLNLVLYDFSSKDVLAEFNFKKQLENQNLCDLYLDLKEIAKDAVSISYGIYDTTNKINIGILDLNTLAISEYKESL